MEKGQQIGRRIWLAHVALGSFALWSELHFGLGRRGWGIVIGGRDLAIGVAHAQKLGPAEALRVNMGRVNGYVLVRGKEAAVVDTGTSGNASTFAEVIRTAGEAVRNDPIGPPLIPNWNRVLAAIPDFGEQLLEAVRLDNTGGHN